MRTNRFSGLRPVKPTLFGASPGQNGRSPNASVLLGETLKSVGFPGEHSYWTVSVTKRSNQDSNLDSRSPPSPHPPSLRRAVRPVEARAVRQAFPVRLLPGEAVGQLQALIKDGKGLRDGLAHLRARLGLPEAGLYFPANGLNAARSLRNDRRFSTFFSSTLLKGSVFN